MSFLSLLVFVFILLPSIQCPGNTRPGCPPPVAQFVEEVELNVLLVVDLLPGLQAYCDTTVAATANIKITFCDGSECGNNNWEIVENVVNFKGARGLTDSGADLQSTEEAEIGQDPESDFDKKLILGLVLITLVTFSLILGLIYFWCPGMCCCLGGRRRGGRRDGHKKDTNCEGL